MSVPAVGSAAAPGAAPATPPAAGLQGLLPFMLLLPAAAPEVPATAAVDDAPPESAEDPTSDDATPLIGWLFDSFAMASAPSPAPAHHQLPAPADVLAAAVVDNVVAAGAGRADEPPQAPPLEPALPATLPTDTAPPDLALPVLSTAAVAAPVPPATMIATAAAGVPVAGLPAPLVADAPEFAADLGEHIAWQVQQDLGEATIELHPAELGALTIRIETQAQQAQVHIVAADPAARALLSQCLPQLRELLGASGLTLTRSQVESGERRGAGSGTAGDGLLTPRGARRRIGSVTLVDAYA